MQQAIIEYFATEDKLELNQSFMDKDDQYNEFRKAVRYCQKHQYPLYIAMINVLGDQKDILMNAKRKLKKLLRSCDIPSYDRLSWSIALELLLRTKLLISIMTKAALNLKKAAGHIL